MTTKREDRKMAANENAAAFLARLKTSFNDSGRNVRLLNTLDKLITGANHKHLKARLAKSIIFTKGARLRKRVLRLQDGANQNECKWVWYWVMLKTIPSRSPHRR